MLTRNDRLIAEAIAATHGPEVNVAEQLASATGVEAAAWAIVAGQTAERAAIPTLVTLLGEDDLAGQAAAWALGTLGEETALRGVIPTGRIDARQNAYHGLAIIAAHGKASATLAAFLVEHIDAEIERTRTTGSGLAEQAAKALAVLGHPQFADLAAKIIDNDRFCDRYELDRLGQAVANDGRDRHAITDLTAPWTTVFADHLAQPEAPVAPEPVPAPATKTPAAKAPAPIEDSLDDDGPLPGEADLPPEGEIPAGGAPVDWKAFTESAEYTALTPQAQGLVSQLGPMLEQLAQQAVRAPLTDLSGQEFAALLVQVLPQALQPQHVQMALHPYALNGYQALGKFLHRTGAATQGDSIVQGVKLVRTQLQAQMRRSGMLGGPDYSDPDEAKAPA